MANVFLSPSTQEYNMYYDGSGSEEYYMNLIADFMEPYLTASGIEFTRNDPNQTVGGSVRQSNAGNYNFHLAIHSNAAGSANYGQQRGSDIYYYTTSSEGRRAADIAAREIRNIYPNPDMVRSLGSTSLYELNNTVAPAILVEVAYHDNPDDAEWIKNNLPGIARALARAVAEFLGVPFVEPTAPQTGTVVTQGGRLNIRNSPSLKGNIIGQIPNGQTLNIISRTDGWYLIRYNNTEGYVFGEYVRVN
ncbi:MAG: peptidoglycan hydrolase [Firmicutes bacterium HGW-Firmicutes-21]|nr:MAG: peptidoglycan hydrolase [Firmicutes bacterium HGW-Firmicutes-21]